MAVEERLKEFIDCGKEKNYPPVEIDRQSFKKLCKDIEEVLNMLSEGRKYIKIRGIKRVSMGVNYKGLDGLQIKVLLKVLGEE